MPLKPGMRMSETTQVGSSIAAPERKAFADSYAFGANPLTSSRKASESRIAGSSSTTWMMVLSFMGRLHVGKRNRELKDGAAAAVGTGRDTAAMRLYDGSANRETDAHSVGLAGDERLKQVLCDLGTDTSAGIHDREQCNVVASHHRDGEVAPARCFHRLHRVPDQIVRDLLDLNLVGHNVWKLAVAAKRDVHALFPRADQRECCGFLKENAGVLESLLGFTFRDELPQTLDDVAGAKRLVRAAVHRLANAILVDLFSFQKRRRTAQIARDRRQRLVQLMRQRRRHFTHSREA